MIEVGVIRSTTLDQRLAEALGSTNAEFADIATSALMAVQLEGAGFDIAPLSDREQPVTASETALWEFNVRAIRWGSQELLLMVSMRLPVDGLGQVHKSVPVLRRTITVTVSRRVRVGRVLRSNWKWAVVTAIALAGTVGAFVR